MISERLPYAAAFAGTGADRAVGQSHLWAATAPDPVSKDLAEYQARIDRDAEQDAILEQLTEQRLQFLTEDAAGIALVREYLDEDVSAQDTARSLGAHLFALFKARESYEHDKTAQAADRLCALLEETANEMAERWAMEQISREDAA